MTSPETPKSLIPQVLTSNVEKRRPSLLRLFFATVIPPLVVLAIEFFLWPASSRWSLFTPAVLAGAWFGGFESGVAATLLSTALMWWFFVPPEHLILKPVSVHYFIGLVFLCTGIVISEALQRVRRIALALARTQRLFHGVVQHSPNGIAIKDLERRYIVVNKAFEDITGVKTEAALGHRAEEVLPRPLAEVISSHDREVLEKHAPVLFEATLDHAGAPLCVLVSHFPLADQSRDMFAIGAIAMDITQQKRDQQALRESLTELRIAEHVAHVGSWRWDFRTNKTTWSDELYDIFGIDRQRSPVPLIAPGLELLSAESILRLTTAVEKLRNDGVPFEVDLEFKRPDGATRWCTARGEPIRDAAGSMTGVAATAADITHVKHLERLREEWTSIIAHELRQPIGVISNASELIPELRHVPTEELGMLHRIQSAIGTLKRMVDDLLDVSLLEARHLKFERTWVDPGILVRKTTERMRYLTGDRVQIIGSGPRVIVCVDPMRMEQVLANLVSNAAKYGDADTPIQLRVDRAATQVRISVTNRGKGIAADELPRLFDRFARSRSTLRSGVPGLGLGLYITKQIVEAHGGRIWVESEPGKTTTFHIALPATEARLKAA